MSKTSLLKMATEIERWAELVVKVCKKNTRDWKKEVRSALNWWIKSGPSAWGYESAREHYLALYKVYVREI